MIGSKLSHYDITAHLGSGGFGDVYQATDTKLGRSVAIKLLPEAFARDAERVARFQREARLLAALNHPNIATLYGTEQADGRHFLVMELRAAEAGAGTASLCLRRRGTVRSCASRPRAEIRSHLPSLMRRASSAIASRTFCPMDGIFSSTRVARREQAFTWDPSMAGSRNGWRRTIRLRPIWGQTVWRLCGRGHWWRGSWMWSEAN